MVQYIDQNDVYDETNGDVESPTGWFGYAGKWTVQVTSTGFYYGWKHSSMVEARDWFNLMSEQFHAWDDEEEEG